MLSLRAQDLYGSSVHFSHQYINLTDSQWTRELQEYYIPEINFLDPRNL